MSEVGEAEGATRWSADCVLPDRGFWFPPTVFTDVAQTHRIAREEIFGPVLSVLTFRTPDEALAKANNTPYGLSAGVWTTLFPIVQGLPKTPSLPANQQPSPKHKWVHPRRCGPDPDRRGLDGMFLKRDGQ